MRQYTNCKAAVYRPVLIIDELASADLDSRSILTIILAGDMGNELLSAASHQEREAIDEKLYFEVFALDPKPSVKKA